MFIYRFYTTIIFDFVFNKSWCCNVSQNSLDQETFSCIVQFCWANWASVSCSYLAGVLPNMAFCFCSTSVFWRCSFAYLGCDDWPFELLVALLYQINAAWLLSFELLQCDWLIKYLCFWAVKRVYLIKSVREWEYPTYESITLNKYEEIKQ